MNYLKSLLVGLFMFPVSLGFAGGTITPGGGTIAGGSSGSGGGGSATNVTLTGVVSGSGSPVTTTFSTAGLTQITNIATSVAGISITNVNQIGGISTNSIYLPLKGAALYLNTSISFQGVNQTNGAPVTVWPDLSGQNNTATIISGLTLNQGVCNGYPGVNMQAGYMVFSNMLSKYNLDTNFNITIVWGGFSKVPGSGLNSWLWAANDSIHNTGLLGDQASSANNYGGMNIVGQTNSFLLTCYRQFDGLPNVSTVNYNGQVLTVWLNGMLQYNSAASREGGPTVGVGLGMAGSFWIGNDDEGNTPWLNGWISAVVLITNSLTVPQIMANNNYWCHFAGRTQDQLALAGESQLAGFGAANGGSPLAMLTGSFPGWDIENNAEPSQNSAGTLTNATVWQYAKHTENKFKLTVASPNLVNDLFTGGGTTNTTIAGFTNFCALSHSNGWTVGFLTIPSEVYIDTNNQTPRAVVNTWLYANWSQWADFIVDIASIPSIGTNGACSNLTYYASDMTHLNSAGWAIASNVLVNAISSYIQSKQSQGGITGNATGLTNLPASQLIGTEPLSVVNPAVITNGPGGIVLSNNALNTVSVNGNTNTYVQMNLQNSNAGTNASGDIVITSNNGNDTTNYWDMFYNSSIYSAAVHPGLFGGAGDAGFLYGGSNNIIVEALGLSSQTLFVNGGTTNVTLQVSNGYVNVVGTFNVNGAAVGGSASTNLIALQVQGLTVTTNLTMTNTGMPYAVTWATNGDLTLNSTGLITSHFIPSTGAFTNSGNIQGSSLSIRAPFGSLDFGFSYTMGNQNGGGMVWTLPAIVWNGTSLQISTTTGLWVTNAVNCNTLKATNGITSLASNLLAPASISFPATTVPWTNTFGKNIIICIDNGTVTGTAITKNGTTLFTSVTGDAIVLLQPGEYFSETYTVGSPSAKWYPF